VDESNVDALHLAMGGTGDSHPSPQERRRGHDAFLERHGSWRVRDHVKGIERILEEIRPRLVCPAQRRGANDFSSAQREQPDDESTECTLNG
jgi:hypothetical protein